MSRFVLATLAIVALGACEAGSADGPAKSRAADAPAEATEVARSMPDQPIRGGAATPRSAEADDSQCGADKLGRWLNVLPTQTVKDEIAATVGDRPIRYYGQGDPITMDFSPSRLNVELGEDGRIKLFRCG